MLFQKVTGEHLQNVKIRMMKSKMKFLSVAFLTFVVTVNSSAQSQQSDRMITITENPWQADQGDGVDPLSL